MPLAIRTKLVIKFARSDQFRKKLITRRPLSSGDIHQTDDHARVRQYAVVVINQKINIIKMISSDNYTRKSDRSSSVGAHIRHSTDHFDSVFGAEEAYSLLDYDARNRDTDIEKIKDAALVKCKSLLSRLTSLKTDIPVQVKFISDPSTGNCEDCKGFDELLSKFTVINSKSKYCGIDFRERAFLPVCACCYPVESTFYSVVLIYDGIHH